MLKKIWFPLFAACLLIANPASAKKFHIYGEKKNGTKFREVIYSWPVPMRKGFSALKPKYQQIVRLAYEELPDEDTPPYPSKGVISLIEPYIDAYRYYGESTTGTIWAEIDEDGAVTAVSGSNGMRITVLNYMRSVLANTQFDPGLCAGSPCAKTFRFELLEIRNQKREKGL